MDRTLTVARHAVPAGPDGLSPLQRALIDDPARVRLAEAPTGAGKSYAFQRALRDQGQRILFIVPTRRLAQNLATGLIQDLIQTDKWAQIRAEGVVALWSADQTALLKEQGITQISGLRLRQMAALQLGSDDGEMIIAVPEVVSALLTRRPLLPGHAAIGIFDLLEAFDHIVFDEFHSIEARGFGLAALFARLVTAPRAEGVGFGRAKVSFLSATPLDLLPTLVQVGVPANQISRLRESVQAQGRFVHGDVRLTLIEDERLYDLLLRQLPAVTAELTAGRQVVVIYNALADLERDLPALAQRLPAAGIDPRRVLVVNSVRDSIAMGLHQGGFATGRQRDPLAYDLILATASVEMGVTFRNANLMLMDPGFEPMNFLQRYGRAARRGEDGQVFVRVDPAEQGRKPWLRELSRWVEQRVDSVVEIQELTQVLSRSVQQSFISPPQDDTLVIFGQLPRQAVACAGLYWNLLLDHPSNQGPRRHHLLAQRPSSAKRLYALEQEVRQLATEPELAACVQRWLALFHAQGFDLRGIEPKVRVVSDAGEALDYPRLWLQRETEVFERGIQIEDAIHLQGRVEDYWRETRDHQAKRHWICYFPHTTETRRLVWDPTLIKSWCQAMEDVAPYAVDWDDYPQALQAAKTLVRLTGLVPGHDPELSLDALHGVL
jgi:hypothetical protein